MTQRDGADEASVLVGQYRAPTLHYSPTAGLPYSVGTE
jgi:hypothetical protein